MREWKTIKEYDEILFEQYGKIAKITINRPEVHNAFTPKTVFEMIEAFTISRDRQELVTKHSVQVVIRKFEEMVGMLVKTKFHV